MVWSIAAIHGKRAPRSSLDRSIGNFRVKRAGVSDQSERFA
jgi:hypothetical protein